MTIVVAFIANAEGRAALAAAISEAEVRQGDLVVFVHAARGAQIDLAESVAEAEATLAAAGMSAQIHHNENDDLAEALLRVAAVTEAGLIVIGLRRRSVTGKLILGSNAQRILLDSTTPVLAIKP